MSEKIIDPPACRPSEPSHYGAVSMEIGLSWAADYPHLRPCPRADWSWVDRKVCAECPVYTRKMTPQQAGSLVAAKN